MFKSLYINNFKQLSDFRVTDLNRVNIIAGKNNTGKSSVLEALFLLWDRSSSTMTTRSLLWRGIKYQTTSAETAWGHLFPFYDTSKQINIALDDRSVVLKQSISKEIISSPNSEQTQFASTNPAYTLTLNYSENDEQRKSRLTASPEGLSLISGQPATDVIAVFTSSVSRSSEKDAHLFSQFDQNGQTSFITDAVQLMVPELKGLSIGIHGTSTLIQAELTSSSRKIPVALLGDGTSKLISLLLSIASAQNGIVLIDEIENGFHYSVMPLVWKTIHHVAELFNAQLFITTHSYEMLMALADDNGMLPEAFSYIRLDKLSNGNVVPVCYPREVLASALTTNWEVR